MDTSLLHPGKRRSFPTAAAIIFILSSVVLVSCIIVRTRFWPPFLPWRPFSLLINCSEDQVSILQEQQLKWEGRGESSARNEVEIFKKMGLIPKVKFARTFSSSLLQSCVGQKKVKPYKWLGRGEKSAIKAIKDYHEAFPVPDYEWVFSFILRLPIFLFCSEGICVEVHCERNP